MPAPEHLPRFLSFTVHQTEVVREPVRLTFEPTVTVFVGRNGAGKSALVEAVATCVRTARHGFQISSTSGLSLMAAVSFECEVHDSLDLMYRLRVVPVPRMDSMLLNTDEMTAERGAQKPLWEMAQGVVFVGGVDKFRIAAGTTVLSLTPSNAAEDPPHAERLRAVFDGVEFVPSGIPRTTLWERPLAIVTWSEADGASAPTGMPTTSDRVLSIAQRLVTMYKREPAELERFQSVLARVGIANEFQFDSMRLGRDPRHADRLREFVHVSLGNDNLGQLPDGTLRAIEILLALHGPSRTLFIEEPETGAHPGLITKLLSEIESAASSKQIVLTTHSPQVLSGFDPEALRLVTRDERQISVRALEGTQLSAAKQFLEENGTLGELTFQGPLND